MRVCAKCGKEIIGNIDYRITVATGKPNSMPDTMTVHVCAKCYDEYKREEK